jgi:hypothetical protein
MVSQHLQMSEWWPTETSPSHSHDLLKIKNEKKIVPNDAYTVDINRYHSTDQQNTRYEERIIYQVSIYITLICF